LVATNNLTNVYEEANDQTMYPSEVHIKNNQNEILFINQKLSDLITEKNKVISWFSKL